MPFYSSSKLNNTDNVQKGRHPKYGINSKIDAAKNLLDFPVKAFLMPLIAPFFPWLCKTLFPLNINHVLINPIPITSVIPKSSNPKQTKIIPIKSSPNAIGNIKNVSGVNLILNIYINYTLL